MISEALFIAHNSGIKFRFYFYAKDHFFHGIFIEKTHENPSRTSIISTYFKYVLNPV